MQFPDVPKTYRLRAFHHGVLFPCVTQWTFMELMSAVAKDKGITVEAIDNSTGVMVCWADCFGRVHTGE